MEKTTMNNKERKVRCVVLSDGWVVCGKCGRKLARISEAYTNTPGDKTRRREQIMTFKCRSCKSIGELEL